mmetsp:Transcript_15723/g.39962  ORF Transcript_15723/g.39962 Transcript_15723/m.39962 type:complete len:88 (+) Transcript_15723:263-526(+)
MRSPTCPGPCPPLRCPDLTAQVVVCAASPGEVRPKIETSPAEYADDGGGEKPKGKLVDSEAVVDSEGEAILAAAANGSLTAGGVAAG